MSQVPEIVEKLRAGIISGEFPFCSRLTIDQLASRFRTSHMPIREALRQLAGEGIIELEPHRGARVRAIDESFIADLMDLRASIETHMARRAVEHLTKRDIEQLCRTEQHLERCIQERDYDSVLTANRSFHAIINTAADSPDSRIILDRHWLLLAALWRRYGFGPERFAGVASDHQHLIFAFEARDVTTVGLVMGAHVMKSKQLLIRQIRKHPPEAGETTAPEDSPVIGENG